MSKSILFVEVHYTDIKEAGERERARILMEEFLDTLRENGIEVTYHGEVKITPRK